MGEPKLEWMYRNANEIVDTEEYLLGKPIDKAFEQASIGNEIEKDCLPTSIFSNKASNIQVDVVRKMKEDPLEIIRQQEIERRKQLLKNPVKLKKLQNMLKAKEFQEERKKSKKKKKKKKKKTSTSTDEDSQDIDSLLTSKYLTLMKKHGIKSLSELSSLKIEKKRLKTTKESSSESESDMEVRKKTKKRSYSTDSENEVKGKSKYRKSISEKGRRKYKTSSSEWNSSETDSEEDKHRKYKKSHKREETKLELSEKMDKYTKKSKDRFKSSDSENETTSKSYKKKTKSKKEDKKSRYEEYKNDNVSKSKIRRKHSVDSSSDQDINDKKHESRRKRNLSRSRSPRPTKSSNRENNDYSVRDSLQGDRYFNKSNTNKKSNKLSEEEKQKKLQEMMENAKWRDDVRVKNVARYKKEEAAEDKEKEYNEDFIRNQMAIATSSGSVESRIKSNINNIQRSKFSMSENFARR